MKKTATKREQEMKTITYMIAYYCRKQHHEKELCPACRALLEYAKQRITLCPFMETKTFCSACRVHCYQSEKREAIREVMRYSGPRMLLHKPIMALRHIYIEKKEKRL